MAIRPFAVALEYRASFLLPADSMPGQTARRLTTAVRLASGRKDEWSEPMRA